MTEETHLLIKHLCNKGKGEGKYAPCSWVCSGAGRGVVVLYAFLTSALEGGEWLASHSVRFTLNRRPDGAHWLAVGVVP
jgi:hypothetical protein